MSQPMKDVVPPHNKDAEMSLLGALLIDPQVYNEVMNIVRPGDFYVKAHMTIATTLYEMAENNQIQLDLISLKNELIKTNSLDKVGGLAYISELTSSVPSSAHAKYYAEIVADNALRRSVIRMNQELISLCYENATTSREILEEAEKRIFEISENRNTGSYVQAKDLLKGIIEKIEQVSRTRIPITGILSGFTDLDRLTNGFSKGELIILAARPNMGKTSLALNIAVNMAIHQQISVGFFTLEMPTTLLLERVIASEARLDFGKMRTGYIKKSDLSNIWTVADALLKAPLFIDDTPGIKLLDLKALARRMKMQEDIQCLFVDYIGIITSDERNLPRHEQVAEFSRSLKALARELQIPIIALAQVTRDVEGKAPGLANLRDSGSLEQDADMVIFVHRERGLERDSKEGADKPIVSDVIVGKNRNGPVGKVNLNFFPAFTRFDNFERGDYD